jgi:CheY-like chemotaxis protein
MRIAVIDDQAPLRDLLLVALSLEHDVVAYGNGLDALVGGFSNCDCAIVDAHLDPANWTEDESIAVLRHLAAEWPGVYRILYTGSVLVSDLTNGLADEVVEKGLIADLLAAIARVSDR